MGRAHRPLTNSSTASRARPAAVPAGRCHAQQPRADAADRAKTRAWQAATWTSGGATARRRAGGRLGSARRGQLPPGRSAAPGRRQVITATHPGTVRCELHRCGRAVSSRAAIVSPCKITVQGHCGLRPPRRLLRNHRPLSSDLPFPGEHRHLSQGWEQSRATVPRTCPSAGAARRSLTVTHAQIRTADDEIALVDQPWTARSSSGGR
jgi:hypothetical protein